MTVQVEFVEKENSHANQNIRYWFKLDGHDMGTDIKFENSQYAIVEYKNNIVVVTDIGEYTDNSAVIVNDEGYPLVPGNLDYIAVEKHCRVTDKIRAMK